MSAEWEEFVAVKHLCKNIYTVYKKLPDKRGFYVHKTETGCYEKNYSSVTEKNFWTLKR